ncbi:MAG: family efflux transporter [Novosphingobium sp.]|nr:family efflux transporter [Novosphingobium sp.]
MSANLAEDHANPGATARQAGRGDLTQGPILRTLLAFSLPMLLSNVLQTLNGSINSIWVGRLIGESALAATANANIVMFMLFAAVFGFGMATTVRVGHFFGARDIDAARRTFGAGVGLCVILALVGGLLGWLYAPALLHILSTPQASLVEALAYMRVIFITMPFATVSMMISMGLRGSGDSRTPLYAMILTVLLDIALNPLLIIGLGPVPALGIAGSAIASGIANLGGVSLMIFTIYRKDLPIRLRGPELRYLIPDGPDLRYVLGKGLPMGASMLIMSSASVIMLGFVNREGLNAAAAYGASLQVWNYLQMPAFAISSAVSAIVAQNIGAGLHERISATTRVGMLANLVMTSVLAGLIVLFDHPILALFLGGDSPALPIAEHIQLVTAWSFVVMGVMMVLGGTMRAYGVVVMPLIVMIVSLFPGRIGFYYLAYAHIGSEAVWWASPVGTVISALLTWAYYASGRWRRPGAAEIVPLRAE